MSAEVNELNSKSGMSMSTLFSALSSTEFGGIEDVEFRAFPTFSEILLFLFSEEAASRGHENTG